MWLFRFFCFFLLLREIYSNAHLYSYGTQNGDTYVWPSDDGSSGRVTLSTSFGFFGETYSALWVSIHYMPFFSNFLKKRFAYF